MDINKYRDKGLSGLGNLGNTCFINSCVQVLSHTYELNIILEDENYKKKLNNKYESALLLEWDNLRKILWENNCVIAPGKFIKTVQKVAHLKGMDIFTGFSQNDLPEFLLFLIDCFHIALSREIKITISGQVENETDKIAVQCFEMVKTMYTKEYSEIWNLFYGVHVSEISALETNEKIKTTPEPFFMIDLPIPQNNKSPHLIDCFNYYVEGEILDGENAWYNEDTKEKINIRKKIQFWSFPNILVIDLKRFNSRNQKNQILVSFPIDDLDLSNYVIGYKKESYHYELYGVCNHSGNVLGGHYTAYVKNANKKWYHFNDTSISEVGLIDSIVSPKAYCLFYRKVNK
uniref:USP domain-containing protein n=1 Tax=viral metagenome TaxID=1070528 RepID=A0A6C0IHF9_9ZZZZ